MYDLSCEKYGISEKEDICYDAVTRAEEIHAVAIIVESHDNETPRWLSKYHIAQPIFVCTDNEKILYQLEGYYRGCHSIHIHNEMTPEELVGTVKGAGYELDTGVVVIINDMNSKISVSEIDI